MTPIIKTLPEKKLVGANHIKLISKSNSGTMEKLYGQTKGD
ncbi:MAG: hypothetical protein ABI663_09685 [Chryseolinea sp.]